MLDGRALPEGAEVGVQVAEGVVDLGVDHVGAEHAADEQDQGVVEGAQAHGAASAERVAVADLDGHRVCEHQLRGRGQLGPLAGCAAQEVLAELRGRGVGGLLGGPAGHRGAHAAGRLVGQHRQGRPGGLRLALALPLRLCRLRLALPLRLALRLPLARLRAAEARHRGGEVRRDDERAVDLALAEPLVGLLPAEDLPLDAVVVRGGLLDPRHDLLTEIDVLAARVGAAVAVDQGDGQVAQVALGVDVAADVEQGEQGGDHREDEA